MWTSIGALFMPQQSGKDLRGYTGIPLLYIMKPWTTFSVDVCKWSCDILKEPLLLSFLIYIFGGLSAANDVHLTRGELQ